MSERMDRVLEQLYPGKKRSYLARLSEEDLAAFWEKVNAEPMTPREKRMADEEKKEEQDRVKRNFPGKTSLDQLNEEERARYDRIRGDEINAEYDAMIKRLEADRKRKEENEEAKGKDDEFKNKRIAMLRKAGHDKEADELEGKEEKDLFTNRVYVSQVSQNLAAQHADTECPVPPGLDKKSMSVDPECIRHAKLRLREFGIAAISNESFANFITNPMIDGDDSSLNSVLGDSNNARMRANMILDTTVGSYHNAFQRFLYSWPGMIVFSVFVWICTALYCGVSKPDQATGVYESNYFISFLFLLVPCWLFATLCLLLIRFVAEPFIIGKKNRFGYKVVQASMNVVSLAAVNSKLAFYNTVNALYHGPLFFVSYIAGAVFFNNRIKTFFGWFIDKKDVEAANWAQQAILCPVGGIIIAIVVGGLIMLVLDKSTSLLLTSLMGDTKLRLRIWHINTPKAFCIYTPKNSVHTWRDAAELLYHMTLAKAKLKIVNDYVNDVENRQSAASQAVVDAMNNRGNKVALVKESWIS